MKALRLPWDGPIPYRSVEITSDLHGRPGVQLSGRVATAAACEGIGPIDVSLSHCTQYAVAFAMTTAGAVMSPCGEHL